MKRLRRWFVVGIVLSALAIPTVAYAGESKSARLSVSATHAYSASSSSKWYNANQGSVEENGLTPMVASIQNRSSSAYSWISRRNTVIPAGGSASGSVNWSAQMYWRLMLTNGGVSAGYGIVNSY